MGDGGGRSTDISGLPITHYVPGDGIVKVGARYRKGEVCTKST